MSKCESGKSFTKQKLGNSKNNFDTKKFVKYREMYMRQLLF